MNDYEKMSGNDFHCILMEILQETKASELINVSGFYELVAEEFNNEVLNRWKSRKEVHK